MRLTNREKLQDIYDIFSTNRDTNITDGSPISTGDFALNFEKRTLRPHSQSIIINTIENAFQDNLDIKDVLEEIQNDRYLRQSETDYACSVIRRYAAKIESDEYESNGMKILKAIAQVFGFQR